MSDVRKFVIQQHTKADQVHWDLMLQTGEVLHTYRLEVPAKELSHQANTAVRISDHPLKFLTYQGSVNQGKGSVEIADTGTYQLLSQSEKCWNLKFDGKIIKGNATLSRVNDNNWQLLFP